MIDFIKKLSTIIYIDHFAAIFIFKQITLITFNTNKLNLRLVKASQYLSSFNTVIRHKFDKFNVIPDALSRLLDKLLVQFDANDKANILNALYECVVNLQKHELRCVIIQDLSTIITHHVTLMKMSNNFKQKLKTIYVVNKH